MTCTFASQVPAAYLLHAGPRRWGGDVTVGFGRGSKDLGVPTANLPPESLKDVLPDLPCGVYFGCAITIRIPWTT